MGSGFPQEPGLLSSEVCVDRDADLRHPEPLQTLDSESFLEPVHNRLRTSGSKGDLHRVVEIVRLLRLLFKDRNHRAEVVELGRLVLTDLVPEAGTR